MHGNVAEWCLGEYHPSYDGAPSDSRPWITSGDVDRHVVRGGSWKDLAVDCRSANRYSYPREGRQGTMGFRLAMSLDESAAPSRVAAVAAPSSGDAGAAPADAMPVAASDRDELPPFTQRQGTRFDNRPAAARLLRRRR
jgi:sulfatase-modifying factor enzyme 1